MVKAPQEVMDRVKVANAIHSLLEAGVGLVSKSTEFERGDFAKLKAMRTLGPIINAGVSMIQQETAQQRHMLIAERMKQLGYGGTKEIEG